MDGKALGILMASLSFIATVCGSLTVFISSYFHGKMYKRFISGIIIY